MGVRGVLEGVLNPSRGLMSYCFCTGTACTNP